jgi:hypothetical protein
VVAFLVRSAAPVLLVLLLLLVVPPRPAAAQCDGDTVSAITVVSHDPSFLRVPRPLRALARGVGLEHTSTREDVVRHFLLLEMGRPCTASRVAESQRILRLQPFLAEATVRAVPDSAGGVRIEVETLDEIPTILSMRFRGWNPAAVRLGDGNVGGQALHLAARVDRGFDYRTGVGLEVIAYHVRGRPHTLGFEAYRAPLGSTLKLAYGHAFFTALQRAAWHVGYSNVNAYTSFVRPDTVAISLGVVRRFADIGSVLRIGFGRRIGFVGGLLTYERVTPAGQAVVISDSGLVADTSAPLGGPYPRYENVRVNAVVGVRNLSFLEVRGFDALRAVQDVARGVQFGVVVGRGNDTFLSADLYAGLGSRRRFAALRVEAEARRGPGANRWDSMVASGRLAVYVKLSDAHTVIASDEFSSGSRMRIPFQLALGALPGGVRGYHDSRVVGAARSVARLEERWFLGQVTRHVGLGVATFADAGRVWAGDAPFGVNSGVKTGVGVGLLAAVPAQSKRLWRLDFAFPVSPDAHARWEVRLTTVWVGGFWSEPRDVAQVRAGAAPSLIFTWP